MVKPKVESMKDPNAVALGRKGGQATSDKKTHSCRLNAKRPRPRKGKG
jgi:hypothetical protein